MRSQLESTNRIVWVYGPSGVGKTYLGLALPSVLGPTWVAVRPAAKQLPEALRAALVKVLRENADLTLEQLCRALVDREQRAVVILEAGRQDPAQVLASASALLDSRRSSDLLDTHPPLRVLVLSRSRPPSSGAEGTVLTAFEFERLQHDEVGGYIHRRLERAGFAGTLPFSGGALDAIAEYGEGIPRQINLLCHRLYERALAEKTDLIDELDVEHCIAQGTRSVQSNSGSVLGRMELVRCYLRQDSAEGVGTSSSREADSTPTSLAPISETAIPEDDGAGPEEPLGGEPRIPVPTYAKSSVSQSQLGVEVNPPEAGEDRESRDSRDEPAKVPPSSRTLENRRSRPTRAHARGFAASLGPRFLASAAAVVTIVSVPGLPFQSPGSGNGGLRDASQRTGAAPKLPRESSEPSLAGTSADEAREGDSPRRVAVSYEALARRAPAQLASRSPSGGSDERVAGPADERLARGDSAAPLRARMPEP